MSINGIYQDPFEGLTLVDSDDEGQRDRLISSDNTYQDPFEGLTLFDGDDEGQRNRPMSPTAEQDTSAGMTGSSTDDDWFEEGSEGMPPTGPASIPLPASRLSTDGVSDDAPESPEAKRNTISVPVCPQPSTIEPVPQSRFDTALKILVGLKINNTDDLGNINNTMPQDSNITAEARREEPLAAKLPCSSQAGLPATWYPPPAGPSEGKSGVAKAQTDKETLSEYVRDKDAKSAPEPPLTGIRRRIGKVRAKAVEAEGIKVTVKLPRHVSFADSPEAVLRPNPYKRSASPCAAEHKRDVPNMDPPREIEATTIPTDTTPFEGAPESALVQWYPKPLHFAAVTEDPASPQPQQKDTPAIHRLFNNTASHYDEDDSTNALPGSSSRAPSPKPLAAHQSPTTNHSLTLTTSPKPKPGLALPSTTASTASSLPLRPWTPRSPTTCPADGHATKRVASNSSYPIGVDADNEQSDSQCAAGSNYFVPQAPASAPVRVRALYNENLGPLGNTLVWLRAGVLTSVWVVYTVLWYVVTGVVYMIIALVLLHIIMIFVVGRQ